MVDKKRGKGKKEVKRDSGVDEKEYRVGLGSDQEEKDIRIIITRGKKHHHHKQQSPLLARFYRFLRGDLRNPDSFSRA